MRLKKGSLAAKRYMAKIRRLRKTKKRGVVTTRSRVKKTRRNPMPRRRKRRSPRRYIKRSVRRRGGSLTMKNLMMGAAIVSIAEPTLDTFLDKMIPISVAGIDPKDFGKAAIGYYLLKKRGILKGVGASLMIVGVRNIVKGFAVGQLFSAQGSSTNGW